MRLGTLVLTLWLIVGVLAVSQRHEFDRPSPNCDGTATIVVTILAGPLNYAGLNPRISCSNLPRPSK